MKPLQSELQISEHFQSAQGLYVSWLMYGYWAPFITSQSHVRRRQVTGTLAINGLSAIGALAIRSN